MIAWELSTEGASRQMSCTPVLEEQQGSLNAAHLLLQCFDSNGVCCEALVQLVGTVQQPSAEPPGACVCLQPMGAQGTVLQQALS